MEPFPAPQAVFARFAELAIAAPRKRRRFIKFLNFFGITRYAEKSRQKMIALAERGINPFDVDTVPGNFSGIYPEFSFSVLLAKTDDSVAQRATKLILAALKYREGLLGGRPDEKTAGAAIIANDRAQNLFGCTANLRKTGLKWHKDIKRCTDSTHIVVALNGVFHKLDVLDRRGAIVAAEDILGGIESILRAAQANSATAVSYGAITTCIAKRSSAAFYADNLDTSIGLIDEALFLVALDTLRSPGDENEAAQDIHIRNYHNRDYRKSLQFVVLEGGFSGAVFNLFAGVEGATAAPFSSWINAYASSLASVVASAKPVHPHPLEFRTIDFHKLPLQTLREKIGQYSCDFPVIRRLDVVGRNEIKSLNVSPDAFFHAAAHLAYYGKFHKIPSVHNFADMRGIKFGSITRYVSTTVEMAEFLKSPTKRTLLAAMRAHTDRIATIKSGDNPIHYAYYYLYTRIGPRALLSLVLFRLFVPDLFTRHISPDIWASNVPALPGILCMGRFGVLFKFARDGCLAGNYLIYPDHIKICFLSNKRSFLQSWPFDKALNDAIIRLKEILNDKPP